MFLNFVAIAIQIISNFSDFKEKLFFYLLVLLTVVVLHIFLLLRNILFAVYFSILWVNRADQRLDFFYVVHLHLTILHCDFVLPCSLIKKKIKIF